jgi:isohexenylglutaconyl-CoA hydratase
MRQFDSIILQQDGPWMRLTLNRPERRNALTHAMMREIGEATEIVRQSPGARALIIRGAGGYFSAGGDMSMLADIPPAAPIGEVDPLHEPYRHFGYVLDALNRLPIPVVVFVEGAAVGGGLGMVCCADVAITLSSAKFGIPEPKAGFIPSQIIPFVVRRIGEAAARRLAVTSIVVDGAEATALGITHYSFTAESDAELQLAQTLAEIGAGEPGAIAAVKRHVLECATKGDEEVMDGAVSSLVHLLRQPTAQQGIRAFTEKRLPPWAE